MSPMFLGPCGAARAWKPGWNSSRTLGKFCGASAPQLLRPPAGETAIVRAVRQAHVQGSFLNLAVSLQQRSARRNIGASVLCFAPKKRPDGTPMTVLPTVPTVLTCMYDGVTLHYRVPRTRSFLRRSTNMSDVDSESQLLFLLDGLQTTHSLITCTVADPPVVGPSPAQFQATAAARTEGGENKPLSHTKVGWDATVEYEPQGRLSPSARRMFSSPAVYLPLGVIAA